MGSLCGLLLDTVFFAATASATAALRWADFRAATDTGPPFNEEGGGSGTEKLEKAVVVEAHMAESSDDEEGDA